MVLVLNMMDEARALGCAPDAETLSHTLGLAVVPMVATRGEGLEALRTAIVRAEPPSFPGTGLLEGDRDAASEVVQRVVRNAWPATSRSAGEGWRQRVGYLEVALEPRLASCVWMTGPAKLS